jgi:hypothetical protein
MNKRIALIVAVIAVVVIAIFALQPTKEKPVTTVSTNDSSTATSTGISATVTPVGSSSGSSSPTVTITTNPASTTPSWQTYSGVKDFTLSIPPHWSLAPALPISIDNFNHTYVSGGAVPLGGAEIDVTTTTIGTTIENFAAGQLSSAKNIVTSNISVGGILCSEYSYTNTYNSTLNSKNIAVYCERGTKLYEFYLSYRADDPNGAQFPTIFAQFLAKAILK